MSQFNCSQIIDVPDAFEFHNALTDYQLYLLFIGFGISTAVAFLGVLHLINIWKFVSIEEIRNKMYILALLYPAIVLLSLSSMMSPRSASIFSSIGVLYILYAFYTVVSLCRCIYGSREDLSSVLLESESKINFQSPPVCCCMPCLPEALPTETNLKKIEILVFQAPAVRTFILLLNCWFLAETREKSDNFLMNTELAGIPSLLLALFAAHTMARLVSKHLSTYRFLIIFRFVDLSLALFTIQIPLIFDNLARFGVFECGPILSAVNNAKYVFHFTIICQLFIFSLLTTTMLSPEKCALFDKYPGRIILPQPTTEEKILP